MTALRNVDFSVQAVSCLVSVALNEFGVVWSMYECECVSLCVCVCEEKMEARGATTGLISETHLIDFVLRRPFVFLFDESTDMHHTSHAALPGRRRRRRLRELCG